MFKYVLKTVLKDSDVIWCDTRSTKCVLVSQSGTNTRTCCPLTSHRWPVAALYPAVRVRAGQGGKGHGISVSRPAVGLDQRLWAGRESGENTCRWWSCYFCASKPCYCVSATSEYWEFIIYTLKIYIHVHTALYTLLHVYCILPLCGCTCLCLNSLFALPVFLRIVRCLFSARRISLYLIHCALYIQYDKRLAFDLLYLCK